MDYARIRVEPLSSALGAEVSGVDLARPLDNDTTAEIRRAFLSHLVIFFRDQSLTPKQYLRFARTMGEPGEYPFVEGMDGYPEITEVIKRVGSLAFWDNRATLHYPLNDYHGYRRVMHRIALAGDRPR